MKEDYPVTPDGRYFVVRGRLWRRANPNLTDQTRQRLVHDLMIARRSIKSALKDNDTTAEVDARKDVDRIKCALGERGPVWWGDGAPDYNRHMARTTPYADWFSQMKI